MSTVASAPELARRRISRRLLYLFLKTPEQRRSWPLGLDRVLASVALRLTDALGVERPVKPAVLLQRVFLLSPAETQRRLPVRCARATADVLLTPFAPALTAIQQRWQQQHGASIDRAFGILEAGHSVWRNALRAMLLGAAVTGLVLVATTPMSWPQQMAFGAGMLTLSLLLRQRKGRAVTLVLISLSLLASLRYFWWRLTHSLGVGSGIEITLGFGLFAAECYALLILLIGYVQSAWPLNRRIAPLPPDPSQWPSVDVFIPTYNEPLAIVKPTVFAAQNLDWPADKLRVYLLDDSSRETMREFAEATGTGYITRANGHHAKAGNLNHALRHTHGEFIAIFDCDHMPVRSFLQVSMGWLLADPDCALVQTPHHFFTPDPMERNLETFRRVPNESRLFHGLIQDGSDLWNATFFCGSCAVLRRGPLEAIGGIAVETVTEDAHTALKLHRGGYNSVYVNVIQAAGLATENLADHIAQRTRWARGMAQIFSADNPFTGKGLSLFQRLCYSNSMLHFLHGIPRLVFLTAPLAYLFFGWHVFNAQAVTVAAFAGPHLAQAVLATSRMQGSHRHSYWSEVYESLLAWYISVPTTLALINPWSGRFNVTAKGSRMEQSYFDWRTSRPFVILTLMCLTGFVLGLLQLLSWSSPQPGTVILNLAWTTYNLVILGAVLGVAREHRQLRRSHRIGWRRPIILYLEDGRVLAGHSENLSLGGICISLERGSALAHGEKVQVGMRQDHREEVFPAVVVIGGSGLLQLRFDALTLIQERALVRMTFSRADAWLGWDRETPDDRPLASLREILFFGIRGYIWLAAQLARSVRRKPQAGY